MILICNKRQISYNRHSSLGYKRKTIHFQGRRNLGAIYVVPTGPVGNGLSNNINTITVGSVGQYGCVPYYAHIDASVITSGLSEGSNLTAASMVCIVDLFNIVNNNLRLIFIVVAFDNCTHDFIFNRNKL